MGKLRYILHSELTKNFSILLSANILAQVIGLLVYPILSRQYSPEDFGLLNLFLSINSILVIFSTGEYQYAILLPKDEKRSISCFHVGLFIALAITAFCLICLPFSNSIANIFKSSELAKYLWLMPFLVFFSGLWTLVNYWFTRHKRFTNISIYQISQSLISAGGKIGFGFLGISGGMIYSCVIAPFFAFFISISNGTKTLIHKLFHIDKNDIKIAAHEYNKFPYFSLPRAIVNVVSGNLPSLLLTPFFGLTTLGFFGMASTLAFRPITMIGNSLYQIYFQHIAERVQNKQTIKLFITNYIKKISLISVPCFILLYFVMPSLVSWFLGNGWQETAQIIRILLPWLLLNLISTPLCFIPDIFQQQRTGMIIECIYCALRIIVLVIGICMNNFMIAILGFSAAGVIINTYQLCWYMCTINHYEKEITENAI